YPSEATILKEYEKNLPQNAHRQKQILNYFIENNKKIDQRILFEHLGITRTHLKPLIDKQLITLEQEESYRNPYEREYPKTEKKTSTQEQHEAIKTIHGAIKDEQNETFLLYGVTGSGKTEIYLQA